MKSKLLLLGGFLMVPVCLFGLVYQHPLVWAVCPQALVVMFLRQSLHAYDSTGAADYPDLAVAVVYSPLVGWLLSRACRQGRLGRVAVYLAIWHSVAVGLAVGVAGIRNRAWGMSP